jgi:hypothetical protein
VAELSADQRALIVRQLAEALAAAWRKQHRDQADALKTSANL